jgi:hypothetical protein
MERFDKRTRERLGGQGMVASKLLMLGFCVSFVQSVCQSMIPNVLRRRGLENQGVSAGSILSMAQGIRSPQLTGGPQSSIMTR